MTTQLSAATPMHRSRGRDGYRPRKTATLLAQRIVSEIADRDLPVGTPLPPERDMLEQYGVARGTLREALRFLEIQGVITIKTGPGGGPMVARPESRHLASTIAMMLQLTHTSFRSVLEARAVLEPALARRAADRITDEGLKTLHDSLDAMQRAYADLNRLMHDEAFWLFVHTVDSLWGIQKDIAWRPYPAAFPSSSRSP